MEPFQFNPTVNPTVNTDNMYATILSVVKGGVPVPFWELNGPVKSGTLITFIAAVYFMPMVNNGTQLAEGTPIGGAPVSLALNSPKLPSKSTAGVTITGTTTTVTQPNGEAPIEFVVAGPAGGTAIVCLTVGTETYEYTMTLE
jgi:hypothetical protein